MSVISVANGWRHILAEAVEEASRLPPEWCFEISSAETVDGTLKLAATYVSGDVPLDDHLPPSQKLPHPFRAMMRIREAAREKSMVTCECCGRMGKLIGAGESARVRCAAHADVMDAGDWLRARSEMTSAFASEEELMAYFLRDYGAGVDMIRDLQSEDQRDSGDEEATQH